eukprot:TRINITY_DN2648_c0_g3_i1.p1 TRINITY_DN2648_c0_g3~~TRINITY_DN2648_c0_g3_i1.p1  ORF type:complete len:107 (+),score=4.30 TRINITY_DN2648_c0_g3_i1:3-323(+)
MLEAFLRAVHRAAVISEKQAADRRHRDDGADQADIGLLRRIIHLVRSPPHAPIGQLLAVTVARSGGKSKGVPRGRATPSSVVMLDLFGLEAKRFRSPPWKGGVGGG